MPLWSSSICFLFPSTRKARLTTASLARSSPWRWAQWDSLWAFYHISSAIWYLSQSLDEGFIVAKRPRTSKNDDQRLFVNLWRIVWSIGTSSKNLKHHLHCAIFFNFHMGFFRPIHRLQNNISLLLDIRIRFCTACELWFCWFALFMVRFKTVYC